MFDAHSNFGYSTIAVAPSPAGSGTELQVAAGQGALFPAVPFNCTVWPLGVQPLNSNAEIIRVTAIVGDTFTIDRAQEGSSAKAIAVGYQIANTTSVKVFTDIENAIAIQAGTQNAQGPFVFADANGVTFGMNNGTLTASVNTTGAGGGGIAASAGTQSISNGTLVFSNTNGITFGMDNSTLTASHNGITSQTNPGASASNGSFAFQTLNFSNSNGITFGTAPGGIIFASHNGLTQQSTQPVAASASNGSFLFSTLQFSNANNVTFGTSAGGIIFASVAPPSAASINVSAGTTSNNLTQMVFGTGGNVTFGLNGSTLTGSAPTGGGAGTNGIVFGWQNPQVPNGIVTIGSSANILQMDPLIVPENLSFTNIKQPGSFNIALNSSNASTSHSIGQTRFFGIYSRSVTDSAATNFSNSTAWVQHSTMSVYTQFTFTNSSQSYSYSMQWMTDSTGGLSTSSATTTGATANLNLFNSYQYLNLPYSMMITRGEYIIMQVTNQQGTGGHSGSLLRHSVYGNSIFGTLSMAPRFGATSDQTVLIALNVGFLASSQLPANIDFPSYSRRANMQNYIFEG